MENAGFWKWSTNSTPQWICHIDNSGGHVTGVWLPTSEPLSVLEQFRHFHEGLNRSVLGVGKTSNFLSQPLLQQEPTFTVSQTETTLAKFYAGADKTREQWEG